YIVRRPSPSLTIGGGQVVDPQPRRHKRFHEATLQSLETLQRGTPEELLLEALGREALDGKTLLGKSGLGEVEALSALTSLIDEGRILQLVEGNSPGSQSSILMAAPAWQDVMSRAQMLLGHYHRQQPLKRGMSKEELRSRLAQAVSLRAFPHAMSVAVARGLIAEDATTYRLPSHEPTYSSQQQQQVNRLKQAHAATPYSPPSPSELEVEPDVLNALVDAGELVKIDGTLYYTPAAYKQMRDTLLEVLEKSGEVNVASMRDLFGTTRKYAIPFLEHLDEQKVTRRVGDVRVKW
ncbi:MAG TPA: SelB C-terminal domain-containing protein, partial [Chloroflexia bacterium]|nr:SelB C-terminal domain-containing protein [Chloroflexia bacterium]